MKTVYRSVQAGVVSERGRRPAMEDAHYLDLDFGGKGWVYGGIYDGHNGDYAAKYAAENLHKTFLARLLSGLEPGEAFVDSYQAASEGLKQQESGTTAVDFFIRDGKIFTANAGDARAIIVGRSRVRQLTTDHRLDDTVERERVLSMGASIHYPYVVKGNSGIMPTRTIGDEYFKSVGVIALPSIGEYLVNSGDIALISACDGLWDFMSNKDVAVAARQYPVASELVEALKHEVLVNHRGTDNLTVIAVCFSS